MPPQAETLTHRQNHLLLHPEIGIQQDYDAIYNQGQIEVGWPSGAARIFEHLARKHTIAVVGAALGDEGKGRFVDNKILALLEIPGIETVNVIRYQGGNNAGHSVEKDGVKLALHLVPSGVFYEQTVGIMDRGMIIHPDLQEEVRLVEDKVGDLRGKLILSPDAILATDLERAEELLNRIKQGKAKGGTGRGIGPAYAHHYDRQGFHIDDLLKDGWRNNFGSQYDKYTSEFGLFGLSLSDIDIPDFENTKRTGKSANRKVGTKEEFLDRLETFRTWLITRDIVQNTFMIHQKVYEDLKQGVLIEGAQALGLHPWLGTLPDVTSSDTSIHGIMSGTGFWRTQDIEERIGVFKITYTSSVGARRMPTHAENEWSHWVRDEAHEYGTTTGRPRDILQMDLAMLSYNARMAGIEMLAGTHLDIAKPDEEILVCTHYTKDGKVIPYQPGLKYLEGVTPHYVKLPGWDGKAVKKANAYDELPANAKMFLAFIQRRTGYPIVAATTGPSRENYLQIPDSLPPKATLMGGFD